MTFGFVDDITVRTRGIQTLYEVIMVVEKFLREIDMKLNLSKCKIIPICKRLVIKDEKIAKIDVVKVFKWISNNMNLDF